MAQRYLPYPLAEEFDGLIGRNDEREVHFQTLQRALGASDYEARLMQPREVNKLVRKMWREEAIDQFTRSAANLIGIDKIVELMPVKAALDRTPNGPEAHFARS